VANVHPRKRIGDLVDALALVRARVPDARLRVAGACDASARAALVEQARRLGVADAVAIVGRVADVAHVMADAHVVALPSSCEGTPTALIEAMAAGRPVVATRTGHVEGVVGDGEEGYLVEIGDVPAMADRLTRLLADADHRGLLAHAARDRARRHDVRHVAARLLRVWLETAGSPGPRRVVEVDAA
jgi:glycosyltransferase involved in cell wall biosynthesis